MFFNCGLYEIKSIPKLLITNDVEKKLKFFIAKNTK